MIVYNAIITRYFEPTYYEENGFLGFITLNSDFYYPALNQQQIFYKRIEKQVIEYYPFSWLDTSSFSLINFG